MVVYVESTRIEYLAHAAVRGHATVPVKLIRKCFAYDLAGAQQI